MQTIFITGCSGYVGALLTDHLSKREDVDLIVGLDKEPLPKLIQENKKLHFIQKNTSSDWEDEVERYKPSIIIHTAWQIRELYGERDQQNTWNINGSHQVFDFAFSQSSVKKIIHFGSVASYGALATNSADYKITEKTALRKSSYLYAEEKRVSEVMLTDLYKKHTKDNSGVTSVIVVRPTSITGPHGRKRSNFSLQNVLSSKANDNLFSKTISKLMSFMPITQTWVRQFVHEDDVVAIVEKMSFTDIEVKYSVFNISAPGEPITGVKMSDIVHKKAIHINPEIIRIIFFIAWHISRGKIPTPKGSWKAYSYPIVVDGTKVSTTLGYSYIYSSEEALTLDKGQYL